MFFYIHILGFAPFLRHCIQTDAVGGEVGKTCIVYSLYRTNAPFSIGNREIARRSKIEKLHDDRRFWCAPNGRCPDAAAACGFLSCGRSGCPVSVSKRQKKAERLPKLESRCLLFCGTDVFTVQLGGDNLRVCGDDGLG